MNSVIPCKVDCNWPACPQSCSGRPGHQPAQPYLILHKVRGEPAFDVAELLATEDGEEMWIVSTSGHRAYPWWSISIIDLPIYNDDLSHNTPPMPDPWPDHYPANTSPAVLTTDALALLQSIGLGPKAIKRRKVE